MWGGISSLPSNAFVFTFIGRLVRDKGVNELVSAFNRLSRDKSHIYLLLVGPKEQNLDPIDLVTLQSIETNDRIIAVGSQSDVRPFLMQSNAFVLPSYREGLGQVILEAGCMGVPCITTDIIGCNEAVIEGINGELVPPHDEDALYQKMKEWVDNPQKLKILASQCRKSVVERFAQERVWQEYWKVYQQYLQPVCMHNIN